MQVAALVLPLLQASVVEHLDVVLDDKRHDAIPQTFFEKKQASDSAVAVRRYHIETPQENDS